jgi:prepilin-type processing-associated H-X9-DG protein
MQKRTGFFEAVLISMGVCAALGFLFVLVAPVGSGAGSQRVGAVATACMSNLKQLSVGMQMYAGDHDDHLPFSASWMDASYPYTKNKSLYRCSAIMRIDRYGYAMLGKLSGRKTASIAGPSSQPLLFDSTLLGWNARGSLTSFDRMGRHDGYSNSAYLDGHVKRIPKGELP